ncbi:GGDEF domain-containing phosphodiesterase [Pseudidiomarina homiensis]|uniref:GGDEF domain-containing phosphodiesterase n=1 Tax=Pseudidiomarina homiensis TaxID=364198 RepID=UPI00215A9E43|nr:GGDEF domain-containing phosphodiesterase [Pseudidiomarina homiensis]
MYRLRWWQRLSLQITLPMLAAMLAILVGLSYFMIAAQQQAALRSAQLELRSSLAVAQGSFNRMYTADRAIAVPELLSEFHVHPRIVNATIVNARKDLVAVYEPNLIQGNLQRFVDEVDPQLLHHVATTGKTVIHFHPEHSHLVAAAPIIESLSVSRQTRRNVLLVEYLHAPHWYQLAGVPWWPLGLLLLLFFAVGLALWLALQRFIARPAKRLVDAVLQFGRHGFVSDENLPLRLPNEFGILAHNIRLAAKERRHREAQLRKLSAAVEQANESIMITDLDGNIEYVNPAFCETTGYSADEVLGKNPRLLSSGRTPAHDYEALWQSLSDGKTWQGELYNQTKDGVEFREWATISPLRDDQGNTTHYLASKLNITQRVEAEAKIEYLAYYDSLTELPNRTSCIQHLARLLTTGSSGEYGAVVLFDLDGLQRINDVRGFEFGDAILQATASRLRASVANEHEAFVANLGGDLFAVILAPRLLAHDEVLADTQVLVKLILGELSQPLRVQDEQLSVTASAGIVIYPEDAESADAIIRHAETAVHNAKDAGGNQTSVYDVSYSTELEKRYEIERELREAINGEGLELYLQPQMSATGSLLGVEVLIRWFHPEKGMISPGDFIPVAEQTDLIVDLGKWIVRHALLELKRLPAPLTLAINISPRQFRKYDFVYCIERALEDSGADASRLVLEVTENLFVDDTNDIVLKMKALQQSGVQFSIDDFGTGYSSLSYLRKLPLQELKIDQSFVQAIDNAEQRTIVDSVMAIAKNLGLRIVAEGVETEAQANYLAGRDQDVVLQGYLFDKPLAIEAFHQRYLSDTKH